MTVALVKTLNTYSKAKQTEAGFETARPLFELLQKTVKADSEEIRALSFDTLFHLVLIMDRATLLTYKTALSTLVFPLLLEVYPQPGQAVPEGKEERRFVPPEVDGKAEPIVPQDLCIDTIACIVQRLDQSGNSDSGFLEPIVKHFADTNWANYKMAGELFVRIIRKTGEDQEDADMLSFTVQYIFAALLDYLSYSARVHPRRDLDRTPMAVLSPSRPSANSSRFSSALVDARRWRPSASTTNRYSSPL